MLVLSYSYYKKSLNEPYFWKISEDLSANIKCINWTLKMLPSLSKVKTCTGILQNPWAQPGPPFLTWKAKTSNTQCILSMLWPAYKKEGLTCSVLRPFLKKTTNTNSLQTLSSFREQPATWSAAASMALLPAQTELSYGRPPGAWLFTCFGRSTLIGSDPLTTSCWDNRVGLLC